MAQHSEASDPGSSLRWVLYEDVYYAAIVVPAEEAPVDVPADNQFVYFLGSESGSVVPLTAVEPFDMNNQERMNHPAAAAGVAVAKQLIMGTGSGENEFADGDDEWTARPSREKRTKKGKERKATGKKRDGAAVPLKKTRKNARIMDNEDDYTESSSDERNSGTSEGSEESSFSREDEEEEEGVGLGHWREIEKSLGFTPTSKGKKGSNATKNTSRRGFSSPSERRPGDYVGFFDSCAGSPVAPFVAEINYYYRKALDEAKASDCALNLQQSALIRAVETRLVALRAEVLHLRRLIRDAESENEEQLETEELKNIRNRIKFLEDSFSVEEIVKQELHMEKITPPQHERKRSRAATQLFSFVDTSFGYLLDAASATALPRESAAALLDVYGSQKRERERFVASKQGLGKLGLRAPKASVMENWRRSREMIVLDPMSDKRPVSRRFSQTLRKVDQRARECYNAASHKTNDIIPRQRRPTTIYNFNDLRFENERHSESCMEDGVDLVGYNALGLGFNVTTDTAVAIDADADIPVLSPLKTSFDPRATFIIDASATAPDSLAAQQHGYYSAQCSQTLRLPSQESLWGRSEVPDAAGCDATMASQHMRSISRTGRSLSRAGSMSRASSRASSVMWDATSGTSRKHGRSNASSVARGSRNAGDWRSSAKRVILEQLTLYLRGLRGKPAVLNKEDFSHTAKELLGRALKAESKRKGISLSLQATNLRATLEKDVETRLRKSVDNYVLRHFVNNQVPNRHKSVDIDSGSHASKHRSEIRRREDDGEENRTTIINEDRETDSPVYDQ
ncbi:hypothetical protein, conserved [Trypanosoma brucei gambiense DAL972]|uniref:Uncharacterized protein n=1 Tax=Trypanosoma brucei gambiense (strain MHOM/CI/86/DAL972) TaxID=679716 RepID=C9ZPI4_TRYB9|nr:hypothetical protein, conserved [Trypanosoma brucei gambiense DAL972]CBH11312.1 hypothetical protein, conserved [Trypanosoma brucei gambiense DAL972]|eukprot:XP_011773599.1 hypothetical protein, conserved [Trypanosoma brucei gambiense DAL972]